MRRQVDHANVAARLDRLRVWPNGQHGLLMVGVSPLVALAIFEALGFRRCGPS